MKKGLIIGLIAGAAAVTAAAIFRKKKSDCYCCDDEFDDEFDCDCCDCCDCDDECNEIPADKTEEGVIVTDACVAYGNSEEEALNAIEDEVESDEV